jgi:hypothetical protein
MGISSIMFNNGISFRGRNSGQEQWQTWSAEWFGPARDRCAEIVSLPKKKWA